jgi:ABC-type glutathione transport system ATPase component
VSGEAVVRVEGLGKVFGRGARRVAAVDGVGFELARGGSVAIVGESGSGKTTVARCLTGLERPSAGRIEVCGRERGGGRVGAKERRRRAREMQMIFQDPYGSLDPRRRIGDAVARALVLHERAEGAEAERRATEILERVGLPGRVAGTYPRRLSGGQRQRAAIACALAVEPEVLVLDEAVAALDLSIQAQVLNLLGEIRAAGGVSFVFISHDLSVVRQVSETVVVMRKGEVVEAGTTAEVLRAPRHEYTQRLVASVPGPGWDPHEVLGRARATAPAEDRG